MSILVLCKFTPLGFETYVFSKGCGRRSACKFTPLGFETRITIIINILNVGVNLPRWGLKLCLLVKKNMSL